ncbi:hypothetical protein TNCV_3543031 [Trichonephila clavipes]|nr:hypothetical protein TNCV_3543031 [Trichonephila clavipes]
MSTLDHQSLPPTDLGRLVEEMTSPVNGDFREISLFGNDKIRKREYVAISSMVSVGNTRPLPGCCIFGSMSARNTSSWRASIQHGVQQGRQWADHLEKTRHGAYLEYTQDISLQHQGKDPTCKRNTMFCSNVSPKKLITS